MSTPIISRVPTVVRRRTRHSLRRQSGPALRARGQSKSLSDLQDKLRKDSRQGYHLGPVHTDDYAPNRGYEPYWIGGDWVLHELDKNKTTGQCGYSCSTIYERYGTICGRDKYNHYLTFKNYCAMKTHDCDDVDKWLIAYRGPCTDPYYLKTYPTKSKTLQDRARSYMSHYYANIDRPTPCNHPNPFVCIAAAGGLIPPNPVQPTRPQAKG